MQIYPINNINNNPKFGALKGLRYVGEFNPSTNLEHAKIVKAVLDSKAIKQFGEKYNFLARFERYVFSNMDIFYSLNLLPVLVEETPKEEEKIENLPLAFCVATVREEFDRTAINNFMIKIRFTTLDELKSLLQYKIADQKEEQLAEEARKKEHAQILNEIKDAGF